jgi:hypothetical protein
MMGNRQSAMQPAPRKPPDAATEDQEFAARVHALMARANELFHQRRYREAKAAAQQLAEVDPRAFMPEQILAACDRELGHRRTVLLGMLVTGAVLAACVLVVLSTIAHLRLYGQPEPGTLRMAEAQKRTFAVRHALGHHRELEYTWTLLDRDGRPVTGPEQAALSSPDQEPWTCTYAPSYAVATAKPGGDPALRTLVVRGLDAGGDEVVAFRWTLEVADVPKPAAVVATHPPATAPVRLAPGEKTTFRVEAVDGDGSTELTYEWLLDDRLQPDAATATWTFATPPALIPSPPGEHRVTCRVANRFGERHTHVTNWKVEVAAPEPATPKGPPRPLP